MQIISYIFYNPKAYSGYFTISKVIDAENWIVLFFFFFWGGGGAICIQLLCGLHPPKEIYVHEPEAYTVSICDNNSMHGLLLKHVICSSTDLVLKIYRYNSPFGPNFDIYSDLELLIPEKTEA